MPPKKNVNKTAVVPKIPREKVIKPRLKKEKPKLKVPTVLKVKIPLPGQKQSPAKENNVVSAVNTEKSMLSPVKLTTKRQLMLDRINEVAKAQLVKGCPVNTEMEIPQKKKRGRKKKTQPDPVPKTPVAEAQLQKDCPANTEVGVVEKRKKVSKKKKIQPEDAPDPADTAEVTPKKKIRATPKLKPSSNGIIKKPEAAAEKAPKKIPNSTKPTLTSQQNKLVNGTLLRKKSTRRKRSTDEDSSITSPSILGQSLLDKTLDKKVQKPTKVPEKTIKDNADPCITTASESKDVLGSSVTASSTDVVHNNKKQPTVKNTVKRKNGRRKTNIDEDSTITSPSILSQGLLYKTHDKEIQKSSNVPVEAITNNTDSRRTSVTSASEWSWTKDISGSSTTTCITVCSTDFVRIDGKLPIVKLNYCDAMVPVDNSVPDEKKDEEHSLSEDSSSSSSSSSSDSASTKTTVDNFLNLSTSSVSAANWTACSPVSYPSEINVTKEPSILEKLSCQLKKFNLGSHDWDENAQKCLTQMETYETSMFKVMEEEHNILLECIFLSQILSSKCVLTKDINNPLESVQKETDFAKPSASAVPSKTGHELPRRRDSMTFDPNDDDDALSLFAESITGFDSSRVSSSASLAPEPAHEEYVPRPVRDTWAPVERSYRPSKINEDAPPNNKKPVCEKQNADSTSLHKEPDRVDASNVRENVAAKGAVVGNEVEQKQGGAAWEDNQQLTIWTFQPQLGMKSLTLRGVCFFNLISNCRKIPCAFPHWQVDERQFNERLVKLSEEHFIKEYLLIVKFPILRIKYTGCFISECQRRELPKILVEMVIAFITKTNPYSKADVAAKVEALESALLYLNAVELAECEDRLKFRFGDGQHLCDVFMETIANTQNFWRFKPVFLALASFMVRERRTFGLEVAAHILERVCIFKFEQPLALVLLSIIELTDRKIFCNAMMGTFEKQLRSFSRELHERFLAARARGAAASPAGARAPSPAPEPAASLVQPEPDNRYTSPDTTNLDNLNKPVTEPVITRTINLDKVRSLHAGSQAARGGARSRPHLSWSQRSIYDQIPRLSPQPRPALKRPLARQVLYGPRQCKYPRRNVPDFYGN